MEQLEYVPKKVYEAKIARINGFSDGKSGQLVCISGNTNDVMNTMCMQLDQTMVNGQPTITGAFAAFPIYNSEMAHWPPGKKLRITVEIDDGKE
jgi:hypothetical protein